MSDLIKHFLFPSYKRTVSIIIVLLLLLSVPITLRLISQQQDTRQRASGGTLTRLEFNPSGMKTSLSEKQVNLSVLAYDESNNPIWNGVTYEWGISSSNSVGTLEQINDSIATFIPQNTGSGDIYVIAKTPTQTITSSIPVSVGIPQGEILSMCTASIPPVCNDYYTGAIDLCPDTVARFFGNISQTNLDQKVRELCGQDIVITVTPFLPQSDPTVTPEISDDRVCATVIAYGTNPTTGACEAFPTPCDVPSGWEACPSPFDSTVISLSLSLPGIGKSTSANDNVNQLPKRLSRTITARLYDIQGNLAKTITTEAKYNKETGKFEVLKPIADIPQGNYTIKARMQDTLFKLSSTIVSVSPNTQVSVPTMELVSGVINPENNIEKNTLGIADYNTIISCINDQCDEATKALADPNDDGKIDEIDLNILYAGFATRNGD